jgi:hypothetical protein
MIKRTGPEEQELNVIRLKIYKEIKNMTPSEETEYFRKCGKEFAEENGLRVIRSIDDL